MTDSPFLPGTHIQLEEAEEIVCDLLMKATVVGECLECHYAPITSGYCYISLGGRQGPKPRVHRLVYGVVCGRMPTEDILVLHECDNRRCINPAHLFGGTYQDNTDDMIAKGRKVDDPDVGKRRRALTWMLIKPLHEQGLNRHVIADRLGISASTVWNYISESGPYKV